MEHQLENVWSLYVTKTRTTQAHEKNKEEWEDRLEKIHTFQTAEDFWRVYNNIRHSSDMINESGDYYLFKGEIMPEWEHPANVGGGRWIINSDVSKIDELWLRTQLSLIGHMYEDYTKFICGVEMAVRGTRFKIAVWMANGDKETLGKIGKEIKGFSQASALTFRWHDEKKAIEVKIVN